jgi:hypothetical protein
VGDGRARVVERYTPVCEIKKEGKTSEIFKTLPKPLLGPISEFPQNAGL